MQFYSYSGDNYKRATFFVVQRTNGVIVFVDERVRQRMVGGYDVTYAVLTFLMVRDAGTRRLVFLFCVGLGTTVQLKYRVENQIGLFINRVLLVSKDFHFCS